MELLIVAAVVIAAFGAITLGWVLAQGDSKRTAEASEPAAAPTETATATEAAAPVAAEAAAPDHAAAAHVSPEPIAPSEPTEPRRNGTLPMDEPPDARVVEADRFEPIAASSLFVEQRRNDLVLPVNALQLNATDLIATQIERLQAEYIRLETERERLAQELLTSYLIEKIEGSAGRLRSDTKKEAQDLRQQLVKVSADFERAQFRLASLEHLQDRLDDPRVARQIDELVKFVRMLARER